MFNDNAHGNRIQILYQMLKTTSSNFYSKLQWKSNVSYCPFSKGEKHFFFSLKIESSNSFSPCQRISLKRIFLNLSTNSKKKCVWVKIKWNTHHCWLIFNRKQVFIVMHASENESFSFSFEFIQISNWIVEWKIHWYLLYVGLLLFTARFLQ